MNTYSLSVIRALAVKGITSDLRAAIGAADVNYYTKEEMLQHLAIIENVIAGLINGNWCCDERIAENISNDRIHVIAGIIEGDSE